MFRVATPNARMAIKRDQKALRMSRESSRITIQAASRLTAVVISRWDQPRLDAMATAAARRTRASSGKATEIAAAASSRNAVSVTPLRAMKPCSTSRNRRERA